MSAKTISPSRTNSLSQAGIFSAKVIWGEATVALAIDSFFSRFPTLCPSVTEQHLFVCFVLKLGTQKIDMSIRPNECGDDLSNIFVTEVTPSVYG